MLSHIQHNVDNKKERELYILKPRIIFFAQKHIRTEVMKITNK
jgi:hypothetical protein